MFDPARLSSGDPEHGRAGRASSVQPPGVTPSDAPLAVVGPRERRLPRPRKVVAGAEPAMLEACPSAATTGPAPFREATEMEGCRGGPSPGTLANLIAPTTVG